MMMMMMMMVMVMMKNTPLAVYLFVFRYSRQMTGLCPTTTIEIFFFQILMKYLRIKCCAALICSHYSKTCLFHIVYF